METKASSVRSQTRSLSKTQDDDSKSTMVWELVTPPGASVRTQASGSSPARTTRPVAGMNGPRASAPRRSLVETQAPRYELRAEFPVDKPWRVDESSVSRPVLVREKESVAEWLETEEGFGSRVGSRGVQG